MAGEGSALQDAIDLVTNLGVTSMHAAREKVNAAFHGIPEDAIDLAAVATLEVVRLALIEIRRGVDARELPEARDV